MFNIAGYLKKFKTLDSEREKIKDTVFICVQKESGITIDKKSIRFSKGELSFSSPQNTHALIFIKREHIIKKLKELLPKISIDRIRCY